MASKCVYLNDGVNSPQVKMCNHTVMEACKCAYLLLFNDLFRLVSLIWALCRRNAFFLRCTVKLTRFA